MILRVQFLPLAIGLLDTTPKHLWKTLNDIGITAQIGQLQKIYQVRLEYYARFLKSKTSGFSLTS